MQNLEQWVNVAVRGRIRALNLTVANLSKTILRDHVCRRDGAEGNKKMANDAWRGGKAVGIEDYLKKFIPDHVTHFYYPTKIIFDACSF
jgi:hypothetical protein